MMKTLRTEMNREIIRRSVGFHSEGIGILGKYIAWQGDTIIRLLNFNANSVGTCGRAIGLSQDGELGKHLVIYLGDKVILRVCFPAPNLTKLDRFDSHG